MIAPSGGLGNDKSRIACVAQNRSIDCAEAVKRADLPASRRTSAAVACRTTDHAPLMRSRAVPAAGSVTVTIGGSLKRRISPACARLDAEAREEPACHVAAQSPRESSKGSVREVLQKPETDGHGMRVMSQSPDPLA